MSANVFQKILAVRQSIPAIPKSERGYNYTYQGADAVFTAVRSAMNEHGLLLLPSMTDIQATDGSWVITYSMTWADSDSGETWAETWGMTVPQTDSKDRIDDKAMGKAGTYALRYYLLRTLQITTKDDIENDIDAGNPDNLPMGRSSGNTFRGGQGANTSAADGTADQIDWPKFWEWATGAMGLSKVDVHTAVGHDRVEDFEGTKEELMNTVRRYAENVASPKE